MQVRAGQSMNLTALTTLDLVLAAVVLASTLAGALRGLIREAVSLAGWVLAVVLVVGYSRWLGERLPIPAGWPLLRLLAGGALILVAVLLVASLLGHLLHALLSAAKLSGVDRALGALFGFARGVLVVLLAGLAVIYGGLSGQPFWTGSQSAPWIEAALRWAGPLLPPHAAPRILAAGG